MEWIDPNIFSIDGINEQLRPLIMQKETLQYKFNNLSQQVLDIKKIHFKELYIYEQKKQSDKSIMPSKEVLMSIKSLEKDQTYININKSLSTLKIQIRDLDNQLNSRYNSLNNMFTFKPINVFGYAKALKSYYDTGIGFENLMEDIFGNEFNDKSLYYIVNLQRNYKIFDILIERSQNEIKPLFRNIKDEQMLLNQKYEDYYKLTNGCNTEFFINHLFSELYKLENN